MKSFIMATFLAIIILVPADVGIAQTEWQKHRNNPVLNIGDPGQWDEKHVTCPTVLFNGTGYEMWYSGYDINNARIGYAISIDGTYWEKYDRDDDGILDYVLDIGSPGEWDRKGILHPTVLLKDGAYLMWYDAQGEASRYRHQIGYATSPDGVVWEKYNDPSTTDTLFANSDPVLVPGPIGSWDSVGVLVPTVLFEGNTYQMWYHGYDGSNYRIGYAISSDGINWHKHHSNPVLTPEPGEWDSEHVVHPNVLFNGAYYEMWYTGDDGSNRRIGYASSPNGYEWTMYDNPSTAVPPFAESDPVLDLGADGTWDSQHVASSMVRLGDTGYEMWYAGHDGLNWRIGYATSLSDQNVAKMDFRGKLATTWAGVKSDTSE